MLGLVPDLPFDIEDTESGFDHFEPDVPAGCVPEGMESSSLPGNLAVTDT